jgi:DNA-directed RNA polymerase subunit RPC12/RpoP
VGKVDRYVKNIGRGKMQKYDDQSDGCNSICPYCGDKYQVESEDYDEDDHEITCEECGSKYWLQQYFSVDHQTRPDCELNGEEHDYRPGMNNNSIEVCKVCGDCRLVNN